MTTYTLNGYRISRSDGLSNIDLDIVVRDPITAFSYALAPGAANTSQGVTVAIDDYTTRLNGAGISAFDPADDDFSVAVSQLNWGTNGRNRSYVLRINEEGRDYGDLFVLGGANIPNLQTLAAMEKEA